MNDKMIKDDSSNVMPCLKKIQGFEFYSPEETRYGRALEKKDCATRGDEASAMGLTGGVLCALVGLLGGAAASSTTGWLVGLSIAGVGALIGRIIGSRKDKKDLRNAIETIDDATAKFAYCLVRAVVVFNERVRVWNHYVEGRELGVGDVIDNDEDILSLLSRSRDFLERGIRTLAWVREGKELGSLSLEPKLTAFLVELAEAESELYAHLAALKESGSFAATQLLEHEAAYVELEGELCSLLPAKAG